MKKVLAVVICFILIFTSGCKANEKTKKETKVAEARHVLEDGLNYISTMNFDDLESIMNVDEFHNKMIRSLGSFLKEDTSNYNDVITKILPNITTKINSGNFIDEKNIDFKLSINSLNNDAVNRNFIQWFYDSMKEISDNYEIFKNGGTPSSVRPIPGSQKNDKELLCEVMNTQLDKVDDFGYTTDVSVRLVNRDNGWHIVVTDDFINALIGDKKGADERFNKLCKESGFTAALSELYDYN